MHCVLFASYDFAHIFELVEFIKLNDRSIRTTQKITFILRNSFDVRMIFKNYSSTLTHSDKSHFVDVAFAECREWNTFPILSAHQHTLTKRRVYAQFPRYCFTICLFLIAASQHFLVNMERRSIQQNFKFCSVQKYMLAAPMPVLVSVRISQTNTWNTKGASTTRIWVTFRIILGFDSTFSSYFDG